MSRITLNLKKAGVQLNSNIFSPPKSLLFDRRRRRRRRSSTTTYPSFIMSLLPSIASITVPNEMAGSLMVLPPPAGTAGPLIAPANDDKNERGLEDIQEDHNAIDSASVVELVMRPPPAALALPSCPALQMV